MPTHSSSSRDRHSSTYDTHEGSSQKRIRVGNINGTLQGILRWFANVLWTVLLTTLNLQVFIQEQHQQDLQ